MDLGTPPFFFPNRDSYILFLDEPDVPPVPVESVVRPTSVCLPYAFNPGMDLSSSAYQKATALLRKVADEVNISTGAVLLPADFSNYSPFYYLSICLISLFIFPDRLLETFNDTERKSVMRAKEVLTNQIMAEVQFEDPKAQDSFETVVRHQVVMVCQNLRVSLCLLDHLMCLYNDAVTSGKTLPGRH